MACARVALEDNYDDKENRDGDVGRGSWSGGCVEQLFGFGNERGLAARHSF